MAYRRDGFQVDTRSGVGRQVNDRNHRARIPVNGLSVPPQGYSIALYFNGAGEFVQRVGEYEGTLNPWFGVQIRAFQEDGRDWKRSDITKYEGTLDILNVMKSQEGKEPLPGISTPGKL